MTIQLTRRDALLRIDLLNDFMPTGTLPVAGGDQIIEGINRVSIPFNTVGAPIVDVQDWHPAIHESFASNHPDKKPFETITLSYGVQVLWTDHCIQGTKGAEFHKDLNTNFATMVIRKGMNPKIDSYSAFFENDKKTVTGLSGYLNDHRVKRVFLVGLAFDFCVGYSALDAAREGFETYVILDLTRSIDLDGSMMAMMTELKAAGVRLIKSTDIDGLPHMTNTKDPIDFPQEV